LREAARGMAAEPRAGVTTVEAAARPGRAEPTGPRVAAATPRADRTSHLPAGSGVARPAPLGPADYRVALLA